MDGRAFENVALLLVLMNAYLLGTSNADFNLTPLVNHAVVGQATYFDCTPTTHDHVVHWYHYSVGARDHENICLYCFGQVHPQYASKITVERVFDTDIYRLLIKSVQWEDSGKYVCDDNGEIGESLSAELVVLGSTHICLTNIDPDGVLGPNDCGLKPDELKLSCHALYNGNIPPILQWRDIRSLDPVKSGVSCHQKNNNLISCNLGMNASFDLNGSTFVCETNTSSTIKHNCSSGIIQIIHVNINDSSTELPYGTKDTVTCSANSSQSCSYRWKWVDGVNEEVVSNSSTMIPFTTGWHKCAALCNIRGNQCTVSSRQVHVSEQTCSSQTRNTIISVVITIALICVFLAFSNDRRACCAKSKSG